MKNMLGIFILNNLEIIAINTNFVNYAKLYIQFMKRSENVRKFSRIFFVTILYTSTTSEHSSTNNVDTVEATAEFR
jgi:hypothetical protein